MKNIFRSTILFFAFLLVLLVVLRLPLALSPFYNIDEGIFAASADKIIHGQVLYRDSVDGLAPLTHYFFTLIFGLFGQDNMTAIHISLIFVIFAIAAVLYLLMALIGRKGAGRWAALFFCVFSYTFNELDMLSFQTEWLLALFFSLGAYFLLKYFLGERKIFLFTSGVCFGLSFFSKQPALIIYSAALLFCFLFSYRISRSTMFSAGSVCINALGFFAVVAAVAGYFYANGALRDLWYWFWEYNQTHYVPATTLAEKIKAAFDFEDTYFKYNYLLAFLFFLNVIVTGLKTKRNAASGARMPRDLLISWFFIAWAAAAYAAVSFSGRNFGHYYIMILPPLCLVSADAVLYMLGLARAKTAKIVLISVVIASMLDPLQIYCSRLRTWGVFIGKIERSSLIPDELRVISQYIKERTRPDESIYVWGFAPEFYSLSGRLSASRYIYSNYLTGFIPWTNYRRDVDTAYAIVPGAWDIFMREMKANMPAYIIDTSTANYRYYGKYPPEKFPALAEFIKENYTVEKDIYIKSGDWTFRIFRRKA